MKMPATTNNAPTTPGPSPPFRSIALLPLSQKGAYLRVYRVVGSPMFLLIQLPSLQTVPTHLDQANLVPSCRPAPLLLATKVTMQPCRKFVQDSAMNLHA